MSDVWPRSVQVAIRVRPNDWGFRGPESRNIDWLLDGEQLHRDNVVFVIDHAIDAAYQREFDWRGYYTYNASVPFYTDHFGWVNQWRWRRFLTVWKPTHFVTYNDYHPRHKIRNAILRASGVQTWLYVHSVNDPSVFGTDALPYRNNPLWLTAEYDHLVAWGKRDADLYCATAQKHIWGPLWSYRAMGTASSMRAISTDALTTHPAGAAPAHRP